MYIQKIFDNNLKWSKQKLDLSPSYFDDLSKGQKPEILYIGCSDSRVTAEEIMGLGPGEVFVHRNIGNMVPTADLSSMSVINYAVEHLKVSNIVVCGHYGCGGVDAAMQSEDFGVLNPWLRNIRDVYRIHQDELDSISNECERQKRLVELNVLEQCINVIKTPEVQKAIRYETLTVHGWVFDIETGKLIDLEIDTRTILKSIMKIYSLTK